MHRLSEVVFPVSRAVEDDGSDDETSSPDPNPVFRWNKKLLNHEGLLECQCLIVAVGPVSTGFVDSVFGVDEREMVGSACCGGVNAQSRTWSQMATSDASCFIWRCKGRPGLAVCQCRETVSSQQTFSWVQQLFQTAKPSSIVILGSERIGELKSGSELLSNGDYYPLLALRSSALTTKPCCPFLEPPNTVGGLCAEILTHCQVKGLPAVLYVTYVSDREPLSQLVTAFAPVLSCPLLQPHVKGISTQLPGIQKISSSWKDTGSLYI